MCESIHPAQVNTFRIRTAIDQQAGNVERVLIYCPVQGCVAAFVVLLFDVRTMLNQQAGHVDRVVLSCTVKSGLMKIVPPFDYPGPPESSVANKEEFQPYVGPLHELIDVWSRENSRASEHRSRLVSET